MSADKDKDEEEPSDSERAEAEALARALDEGDAHAPTDALETAALLRQGELSDLAARRVLEQVTPALPTRRRGLRVAASVAAAALLFVGGAALFVARPRRAITMSAAPISVAARPPVTSLPRPDAALLAAQARATTDMQALDREMSRYRDSLFAALSERYR
jgi:hypothetical protein